MLEKLKAFLAKVNTVLGKVGVGLKAVGSLIWNNSKTFIIAAIGIIAALEFNKIKEYFIVKGGEDEIKSDDKKDTNLVNDEKTDEQKADDLQNEANNLPSDEQPVPPDWYEKK